MQRVWMLNGTNINYDKDFSASVLASLNDGVIEWFDIDGSNIESWKCLIECERTNGEKIMVFFENTENVAMDLTGTKKVYIEIDQAKIDDWSLNSVNGTGIGEITTGASYPTKNYAPLYSIVSWSITDERVNIIIKDILNLVWLTQDISTTGNVDITGEIEASWNITGNEFHWNWSNLTGIIAEVKATKSIFTAGENLTAWQPVCILEAIDTRYDVSWLDYNGENFTTTSQEGVPDWITFNPSWTKLYIIGGSSDRIYQYTLSVPRLISTASYDNKSFSTSAQDNNPWWLEISTDWTKCYVAGSQYDRIWQYNLSTAWDISTASYSSKYKSMGDAPDSINFNTSWTICFAVARNNDRIEQYNLSTAWDISTASSGGSFSTTSQMSTPRWACVWKNWEYLLIVWSTNEIIYQYTLSTAWDISTVSYDSNSKVITSETENPLWLYIWKDDSQVYMVGDGKIFQYSWDYIPTSWCYKTNASDSDRVNFLWFADETKTAWNTVRVNTAWIDDNQSWLTIWSDYYLSDTPWAISTTPWIIKKCVWNASSTTTIKIIEPTTYDVNVYSREMNDAGATVSYTHNLWKKPKFIKITANYCRWTSNWPELSVSTWIYNNWDINCVYNTWTSNWTFWSNTSTTNIIAVYEDTIDWQTGVIWNITSIWFDIVRTNVSWASTGWDIKYMIECS